ncbi:MAG: type II toxin-antitoxin system RelE/ParE family toxin [Planctomycetes bacterium]|nr:type II toxin-antitoxin system RelE/ParE family toxin [Planctomycetota bacterium]
MLLAIARDNVQAAIKHDLLLHEKIDLLGESPLLGRARDDLRRGLRGLPVGNYTIFYTFDARGISIFRVLHAKRNLHVILRLSSPEA